MCVRKEMEGMDVKCCPRKSCVTRHCMNQVLDLCKSVLEMPEEPQEADNLGYARDFTRSYHFKWRDETGSMKKKTFDELLEVGTNFTEH